MDLHLNGSAALVTGASKGIGLAIVRGLAAEGTRVLAVSRSGSAELEAIEGVEHHAADLTDPEAPALAVAAALERFGRLDVLVNNAGGPPPGTRMPVFGFCERTDEEWAAVLDFNLMSAVRACRAAVPALVADGGGAIVNLSSTNALVPSAMNVPYGAAKAAVRNLSQALSEELAPQGVRVNTVTPGPVRTPWWTEPGGAADILAEQTGQDRDEVLDRVAPQMMALTTGRLADPQEVADAVVLLCSPRSGSTTGAEVVVDGGLVKTV